jgi:hypothetical protein
MTRAQVETFFDNYATAFSRAEIDRICELWLYPAFMAGRGKTAALDAQQFRDNTAALCAFHAKQGLARATKRVLEFNELTRTTASVTTEDRLYDAAGAEIANWRHAYLLSECDGDLRVIAALPNGVHYVRVGCIIARPRSRRP